MKNFDTNKLQKLSKEERYKIMANLKDEIVRGDIDAEWQLGILMRWSDMNETAVALFTDAAAQGNARAKAELACALRYGLGVRRNMKKALKLAEESAEAGCAEGWFEMGVQHYFGERVKRIDCGTLSLEESRAATAECMLRAAELGHSYSMQWIAKMYADGDGIAKDESKAFDWYRKSAELGDRFGIAGLASAYEEGIGVSVDLEKAFELYSSVQDDMYTAKLKVAEFYINGMGVEKDVERGKSILEAMAKDKCWEAKDMLKALDK